MEDVKLLKFRTPEVPRQSGEFGRLRILKGAEVGATFVLKSSSIAIGRGEDVDVMIGDLKASRFHARLDYTKEGWVVSDLGSANGIFFQGEYIRKFNLRSGEHFTIGETIFEFIISDELSRVLLSPLPDPFEIERQDLALAHQKVRVQNLSHSQKTVLAGGKKENKSRTLLLLAAAAGAYFYFDTPSPAPKKATAATSKKAEGVEDNRALASYLPNTVSKDVEKTADQYYWLGFREYMKGNYIRAKDNFELALQVNPSHDKARHYLASVEKENEDEILALTTAARKAKAIGRDQDAKGICETVLRHLYNDRANPAYADCGEILKDPKAGGEQ